MLVVEVGSRELLIRLDLRVKPEYVLASNEHSVEITEVIHLKPKKLIPAKNSCFTQRIAS